MPKVSHYEILHLLCCRKFLITIYFQHEFAIGTLPRCTSCDNITRLRTFHSLNGGDGGGEFVVGILSNIKQMRGSDFFIYHKSKVMYVMGHKATQ